jgi:hypothetical protein
MLISASYLSGQTAQTAQKDLVAEKTDLVATRLKLDGTKKETVHKIFVQTDKRITDLAYGTPDYVKLINYINQERSDMLKAALTTEEFSEYQKNFSSKDLAEVNKYIAQNNAFMTKKANDELKEQKETERIMSKDKEKVKKDEEKAKLTAKKEADKQKIADKKAQEKQKAADKKEKEKQKAADKKAKEKQKAEEKKQKEKDKKELARQKALEKKQKELEKKLNKKK